MKKYILLLLLLFCQSFLTPTKALSGSLPEQRFFFDTNGYLHSKGGSQRFVFHKNVKIIVAHERRI